MDHVPIAGLQRALQFPRGSEDTEEHNVIEDEDRPHERAQALSDNGNLVNNSITAGNPQDQRETGGLGQLEESESIQKGKKTAPRAKKEMRTRST